MQRRAAADLGVREFAQALAENEAKIIAELNSVQGKAVDLGGYYRPDKAKTAQVMRPSATLNAIIDGLVVE